MSDQWYLSRDNITRMGPYTMAELQHFMCNRLVAPDDMLLQEGANLWVRADSLPSLFIGALLPTWLRAGISQSVFLACLKRQFPFVPGLRVWQVFAGAAAFVLVFVVLRALDDVIPSAQGLRDAKRNERVAAAHAEPFRRNVTEQSEYVPIRRSRALSSGEDKNGPTSKQESRVLPGQSSVRLGAATPTKTAWEEMGQIDLELRSLGKSDPLSFFEQNYIRYGRIRTDDVDPELCAFIDGWIQVCTETHDALSEYVKELASNAEAAKRLAEVGGAIGSMNERNPQQGAQAGALFFGLIGMAAADAKGKELYARYDPVLQQLDRRITESIQRRGQLGERLSKRYSIVFRRR